jgi:hypothetical protein
MWLHQSPGSSLFLQRLSRTLPLLTLIFGVSACTDTRDVEEVEDVFVIADARDTSLDLNACDGQSPLYYRGVLALPGDPCGSCGDGRLSCVGPEALECIDSTEPNACRSCGDLRGTPGLPCGFCDQGQWTCESGTVECAADRDVNACGGCAVLPVNPGVICGTDREPATWRCISPEDVRCVPDNANACGGSTVLEGVPGSLCGTCNRGTLGCDGLDALACLNEDDGVNECGGCTELAGELGADCGTCGGTWACNDDGGLTCSIVRNGCGGCGTLDATPGSACDGGVWACATTRALECRDEGTNPCGGTNELSDVPGSPCGECVDGVTTCLSPTQTVCVEASERNACGGCGLMPGQPGELCAAGAVFVCDGTTTACSIDIGLNACGGVAELPASPGDLCGTCSTGALSCAGVSSLTCEGATEDSAFYWYPDRDGDGYGDAAAEPEILCEEPATGYSRTNDDCNDDDERFYPDADEDACSAEDDFNCDGIVLFTDEDNDGVSSCYDCDDRNRRARPGAAEVCDGIDNDCDDEIDEGAGRFWFRDADGDNHGNPDISVQACARPDGYVSVDDDCDDSTELRYPGRPEVCDRIDNNCDVVIDGDSAVDRLQFYPDRDADNFGDPTAEPVYACERPDGFVANADDCDDSETDINPSATEICDGLDNNCDRTVDDDAADRVQLFVDADVDGYGDSNLATVLTCPGDGYTTIGGDCDDARNTVNPGARDIPGDGFDQNCDGREFCAVDVDGDGFVGDFTLLIESTSLVCTGLAPCPAGVTPFRGDGQCYLTAAINPATDCNELDPLVNPAASEDFGDGIDSNCDGSEICYRDADNDGFRPSAGAIQVSDNASCLDPGEATEDDPLGDCLDEGPCETLDGNALIQDWCPSEINPDSTLEASTNPRRLDGIDYDCNQQTICNRDDDSDGFHRSITTTVNSTNVTTMCQDTNRRTRFEPTELALCDNRSDINPARPETDFDGVDSNCDRRELCYIDDDLDNYVTTATLNTITVTDPTELDTMCSGRRSLPAGGTSGVIGTSGGRNPAFGDCRDDVNAVNPGRNDLAGLDVSGVTTLDTDCDNHDGNAEVDVYAASDGVCRRYFPDGNTRSSFNCNVDDALRVCSSTGGCQTVFMATGNYAMSSPVNLRSGINLFGGYESGFSARRLEATGNIGSRRSNIDFADGMSFGMIANRLSSSVQVDAVHIQAGRGSGNSSTSVSNSIALSVVSTTGSPSSPTLSVTNSFIGSSAGATPSAASSGIAGTDGSTATSNSGASPNFSGCSGSRCGSYGGTGASRISQSASGCKFSICGMSCSWRWYNAGTGSGGGGSAGGNGTNRCNCYDSDPNSGGGGTGGAGSVGSCGGNNSGNSASLNGSISSGTWYANSGRSGSSGGGGRGGGGGGLGGFYCYCNFGGSSTCHNPGNGGGGGSGGNGATAGGGGAQGGASIAVVLDGSYINLQGSTVSRGQGGTGSRGGNGARGGNGGNGRGGYGKSCCGNDDAGNGGAGGVGGHGGASAAGNGGDGGPSVGVYRTSGGSYTGSVTFDTFGCLTAGCGGTGGNAGSQATDATPGVCNGGSASNGRTGLNQNTL